MTATACCLQHRRDSDRPRYPLPGSSICRGCHDDLSRCLIGEDRFSGGIRTRLYGLPERVRALTRERVAEEVAE